MITDLQRDILIKSAEGIQEGMWCRGDWFTPIPPTSAEYYSWMGRGIDLLWNEEDDTIRLREDIDLEAISKMHRCVEGELAFRTILLGGTIADYQHLEQVVSNEVADRCGKCHALRTAGTQDLFDHNDTCMVDADPFTAGQQWAEIFRSLL